MKKILTAVICIALATTATMAKNNHHHEAPAAQPEVQQQHKMHDPVVNMEIIKDMGLSKSKIAQIEALQQRKQKEMAAHRPAKMDKKHEGRPEPGNARPLVQQPKHEAKPGMDPKHHEAMQAFKADYRKELRSIMGTEKYLTYMERQNDHLAANRHHRHGKKGEMKPQGSAQHTPAAPNASQQPHSHRRGV